MTQPARSPLLMGACVLIAAAAITAMGAEPGLPDLASPLTLQECIDIGLGYATTVRTGQLDVEARELDVSDAMARYVPVIETRGSYLANDRDKFDVADANFDLNVSARYTVWDHGRRRIQLDQVRTRRDASQVRLEARRQDLVLSIVQSYYGLLEARALIDLDEELLELSQGNADQARARVQAGDAIPADVAAVEVRVANDELTLVNDQNALEIARVQLPVVLGLDPTAPLDVVDDPDFQRYLDTGTFQRYERTLAETLASASEQRPEIRESALNLRVLELARTRTRRDRWPQLTANVDFSADVDDYIREGEDFSRFRTWDATARLTFPLFDGGVIKRTVERADIDLESAREQHDALTRSISLEATQAYLTLKSAEKRLEISATQVRDAKFTLDAATVLVDVGSVILLELLDAQTQFGLATINQIRVFYDYRIAQRVLDHAVGAPVPEP